MLHPGTMLGVVLAIPPDVARYPEAKEPAHRLAGLSLLLRAVLTLQHAGVERALVVVPAGRRSWLDPVLADARLEVPVDSVEVAAGSSALAALREAVSEPFVLARYDLLADRAIYRELVGRPLDGRLGVVSAAGVGPYLGTPLLLTRLPAAQLDEATAAALAAEGVIELLPPAAGGWTADATTARGRQRAVYHLFEACRKPVDGIISRHLNRHVSIFISKRLVNLPISPNAMTGVTFLAAVAAAVFAARGGYWDVLAAAACMQLNSILDGVDGELARVRFQGSKLGQWLDTIGDDASNVLFFLALGYGAQQLSAGRMLLVCSWIAAASGVATAALYYLELVRKGSGDLYTIEWSFDQKRPTGPVGWIVIGFRYFMKQDFFIFSWLFGAAAGILQYTLPFFALCATVTAVAAAVRNLTLSRRRAAVSSPSAR